MEKTFEMNEELMLMAEKAKYARTKLSRKEQEHKRDSSMKVLMMHTGYPVKVHRNCLTNDNYMKGCEYHCGIYRYAQEPRKRR